MSNSRNFLTGRRAIAIGCFVALTACGTVTEPPDALPDMPAVEFPDVVDAHGNPKLAATSTTSFGSALLAALAAQAPADDNVVVSPLSIVAALALLEPGATDDGRTAFADVLGIDDPDAWRASMATLIGDLQARQPTGTDETGQPTGEFTAKIANAAFVAPGYPLTAGYVDAIGTHYGPLVETLDVTNGDAAAKRINAFIAEHTDGHITDLTQPEMFNASTVLALVNALLLKASWQDAFEADSTDEGGQFTVADGSVVTVPLMHGWAGQSASGDGWVGASKALSGNVSVQFVLPDDGRFDEVAATEADAFSALDDSPIDGGRLAVPRFETRVTSGLDDAFNTVGLGDLYVPGNLVDVANDDTLALDTAVHQAWLHVTEGGIEAAAATVLLMTAAAAPAPDAAKPVDVILDRPFLFRIVDDVTGATLFAGRIMNPTR